MKDCCEKCKPVGTKGIIGTPWCSSFGKCECHKEECKHEDIKLVGAIANTHLCFKCGGQLVCNEIEILNSFYEVGGFCNNEKCERFLLLVV